MNAVAELSDTAMFISVPSGLMESTAISPTFVILLSPKLTLSPNVLFVKVCVAESPTILDVVAGRVG